MTTERKCRTFAQRLSSMGLKPRINYYTSDPKTGFMRGSDFPSQTTDQCVIDVVDSSLDKALEMKGKRYGAWTTTASIAITDEDVSGDIPVSLCDCGRSGSNREIIEFKPAVLNNCWITKIDLHNVLDTVRSPAVHLHIECENSNQDTINGVLDLIKQVGKSNRNICKEDWKWR